MLYHAPSVITATHRFHVIDMVGALEGALLEQSVDNERCMGTPVQVLEQVTPTIGRWVGACFPGGTTASEEQIRGLVQEAADAARSDYGVESALTWADRYVFPPRAAESDTEYLRAVALCTLRVLALLPSVTALRPYGLVVSSFSPLAFGLGFDPWLCRFTP